jgi:hypothetical protein
MNILLLKSGSGYSELTEFMQLVLGKYKIIEVKELDAFNIYVTLSQFDESYNKEECYPE